VREAQVELASAVTECIQNHEVLIAEAGTGTGKTFAYLVPCLLSGQKAIVSTATKILQDQLYQKDLPILMRSLGLARRVQNLKGRANYICRYRVALHAQEGQFPQIAIAQQFRVVYEKVARLQEGDRNELPEIADDAPIWPYVTSTSDNCLGTDCEFYQTCFLVKARRRAMDADVVVINHHLFFADSELKQEGVGELLPERTVMIFDEAHGLPEIATHFFGDQVGTRQLQACLEDIWQESKEANILEAPCHLDLFPDNVFFDEKGKISGVIDFYFSANDFLIFDLAIAINAWCFDGKDFNREKYSKMIDSYSKIRKITESEFAVLPKMLIGAALRFFLSRLKDKIFTSQDLLATNLVKIKDPQEYFEKLMFFRNFSN
jgi:hypothetical protein